MHDYAGCTIPACPWCISYGDGYAQGKVKILEEVRARLTMPQRSRLRLPAMPLDSRRAAMGIAGAGIGGALGGTAGSKARAST